MNLSELYVTHRDRAAVPAGLGGPVLGRGRPGSLLIRGGLTPPLGGTTRLLLCLELPSGRRRPHVGAIIRFRGSHSSGGNRSPAVGKRGVPRILLRTVDGRAHFADITSSE